MMTYLKEDITDVTQQKQEKSGNLIKKLVSFTKILNLFIITPDIK